MIGKTIGNYQITGAIASGGIGEVYTGIDMMLEREVAIKALRPELMNNQTVVQRFRAEAITLAKLNHLNIATVYAFLAEDDQYYLAMELVHGQTLQAIINRHGALSSPLALALCRQVLSGIEYAHQHHIIHRDLKPANIMLSDQQTVKVMDFGIARVLGTEPMTRTGYVVGTPEYMAPEQICCQETDARTDIYSLGILLYELVTGRVPFICNSEYDLLRAQVEMSPPRPGDFNQDISSSLNQCITRAMAKAPQERFQTVREFALALEQCDEFAANPECHQLIADLSGVDRASVDCNVIHSISTARDDIPCDSLVQGNNWLMAILNWMMKLYAASVRSVIPNDIPVLLPFIAIICVSFVSMLYSFDRQSGDSLADTPILVGSPGNPEPVSIDQYPDSQAGRRQDVFSKTVQPSTSPSERYPDTPVFKHPVFRHQDELNKMPIENVSALTNQVVTRGKMKSTPSFKQGSGWIINR